MYRITSSCAVPFTLGVALVVAFTAVSAEAEPRPTIAMHGEPAFDPASAASLPYADPDALQGGSFTQAVVGTFDSLNPFIIKGVPADGLRELVFERLMKRSLDEPFTLYGLVAESDRYAAGPEPCHLPSAP